MHQEQHSGLALLGRLNRTASSSGLGGQFRNEADLSILGRSRPPIIDRYGLDSRPTRPSRIPKVNHGGTSNGAATGIAATFSTATPPSPSVDKPATEHSRRLRDANKEYDHGETNRGRNSKTQLQEGNLHSEEESTFNSAQLALPHGRKDDVSRRTKYVEVNIPRDALSRQEQFKELEDAISLQTKLGDFETQVVKAEELSRPEADKILDMHSPSTSTFWSEDIFTVDPVRTLSALPQDQPPAPRSQIPLLITNLPLYDRLTPATPTSATTAFRFGSVASSIRSENEQFETLRLQDVEGNPRETLDSAYSSEAFTSDEDALYIQPTRSSTPSPPDSFNQHVLLHREREPLTRMDEPWLTADDDDDDDDDDAWSMAPDDGRSNFENPWDYLATLEPKDQPKITEPRGDFPRGFSSRQDNSVYYPLGLKSETLESRNEHSSRTSKAAHKATDLFISYTISEDMTGDQNTVCKKVLAAHTKTQQFEHLSFEESTESKTYRTTHDATSLSKVPMPKSNPRSDPRYDIEPDKDGFYHCPFVSQRSCSHKPTKQKVLYAKNLDSHLKPYTCKYANRDETCKILRFSSNAVLFRHEREVHGLHNHGANPYLCTFQGCERARPENGFPRRWNQRDHMKRVHGWEEPEEVSTQESERRLGRISNPKQRPSTFKEDDHIYVSSSPPSTTSARRRLSVRPPTPPESRDSFVGRYSAVKDGSAPLSSRLQGFESPRLSMPSTMTTMNSLHGADRIPETVQFLLGSETIFSSTTGPSLERGLISPVNFGGERRRPRSNAISLLDRDLKAMRLQLLGTPPSLMPPHEDVRTNSNVKFSHPSEKD